MRAERERKVLASAAAAKRDLAIEQTAGRVLVETMDQTRPLRVLARRRQRAEHAVDMVLGAGAALHGEAGRLVEHQHVVVLVEHDRLQKRAILLRLRGVFAQLGRLELERRNAQIVAGLDARLRLAALAVHPHLAFADDALDVTERQAGKFRLEETVEPHVVLVGGDGDGLDPGRLDRKFGHRSSSGKGARLSL